jgi:hypothetical protein
MDDLIAFSKRTKFFAPVSISFAGYAARDAYATAFSIW